MFRQMTAVVALIVVTGAAPSGPAETIAGFDPQTGLWNVRDAVGRTTSFYFGDPGDSPVVGDWDCDGVETPGLFRDSDGYVYLRNSNTEGVADVRFFFGNPGDVPLAGDFDGDGCDTIGLYRPGSQRFFITNHLGKAEGGLGAAEISYVFGNPGDVPFVADFDGDGVDTVGLHRTSSGLVYFLDEHAAGVADGHFIYGDPGDRIIAGNWVGAGADSVGVFRPRRGRYMLRRSATPGPADIVIPYGQGDWVPLTGRFGPPGPDPGRGTLVVHGAGDVNLDVAVIPNLSRYGHDYAWSGLERLFEDDDLSMINLECAPSTLGTPIPKAFNFRCDLAGLPRLAANGIEVVNLANNHSQDYGMAAMLDGIDNVRAAGVWPVGVGRDLAEAIEPAMFNLNGWRVAVLGFGGTVPAASWLAGADRPGMASGDDLELMASAVRSAAQRADLVFVTVHWGIERTYVPDSGDVARAHAMIEAGADAVFGHGPHRLQPLEYHQGKPIFWSLGNFVWPYHDVESATSGVAEVVVQPDGFLNARIIPAFIVDSGHPELRD